MNVVDHNPNQITPCPNQPVYWQLSHGSSWCLNGAQKGGGSRQDMASIRDYALRINLDVHIQKTTEHESWLPVVGGYLLKFF